MKTFFFFAMFVTRSALAITLSEETDLGSYLFTQSIVGYGDFGVPPSQPPFDWDLDYTYTKSSTPNPDGPLIVDHTQDFAGQIGWNGDSGWGVALAINYADTPEERLVARGATLYPSYRLNYGTRNLDDEDFAPYLDFRLSLGSTNYLESFNGSVPRAKHPKLSEPVSGTAELRQNLLGVQVAWKPYERWRLSVGADKFSYNRDVASFQNQLDSAAALQAGISNFSNTVGGLPRVTYTAQVKWEFVDGWSAIMREAYSIVAADSSSSSTLRTTIEGQLTKSLRGTAGSEWVRSDTFTDVLGVLGLAWDFD